LYKLPSLENRPNKKARPEKTGQAIRLLNNVAAGPDSTGTHSRLMLLDYAQSCQTGADLEKEQVAKANNKKPDIQTDTYTNWQGEIRAKIVALAT
jgi:hypothetical protein